MARTREPGRLLHVGMFYQDLTELLKATQRFVLAGLEADEPVLIAQPPGQISRLRDALPTSPRISYVDMTVAGRNPGRILPWILHEFALRHIGRRVRIIDETIWPSRSALVYPACVQHEALVNVALRGLDLTVLCPYDIEHLHPLAIDDAHSTHPFTQHSGGPVRANPEYTAEGLTRIIDQPLDPPPATAPQTGFGWGDLFKLRELVGAFGKAAGLIPAQVAAAKLAVTEAATNAIRHGGGRGTLRVWRDSDHVVLNVHSPRTLVNPIAGRLQPKLDSVSGRGLVLINHVCDLVRMHCAKDAGTTVRMWIRCTA